LLNFWCHCLGVVINHTMASQVRIFFFLSLGYESFWLIHIDLFFKITIQKSSLDIHLMDEHVMNRCKCKKDSDKKDPVSRRIVVKKINTLLLSETLGN